MELEQKKGSNKKTFTLIDSKLHVVNKTMFSTEEWSIDLTQIGHKKEVKIYSRTLMNICGSIFLILLVVSFISFFFDSSFDNTSDQEAITGFIFVSIFLSIFTIIFFKAPLDNHLTITTGSKDIKFLLDSPSRDKVEKFADNLIEKSKKIIVEKYSNVNLDIPEEEFFNQLNWLLFNNLIDESIYFKKKDEYKTLKLINNN